MSAVQYQCPLCGTRMFDEPNSPLKRPCPFVGHEMTNGELHPETIMQQAEEYIGPNFLYKGEGEKDNTKTGVITPGIGGEGATSTIPVLIRSEPKVLTEEEELEELRAMWTRITGTPADRRLKNATLRTDIEALEKQKADELDEAAKVEEEAEKLATREALKEELRSEVKAEMSAELADMKAQLLAELRAERESANGDSE